MRRRGSSRRRNQTDQFVEVSRERLAAKAEREATERFSPHFGGFGLNSLVQLDRVLSDKGASPEDIGKQLAFFYRCFDRATHQVQLANAPEGIQGQVDGLRDMAIERLEAAGVDPAQYNGQPVV